jgi:hypothetical protein
MLTARMPASFLASLVNAHCGDQCLLTSVSGPWWAGTGLLLVNPLAGGEWQGLGQIDWQLLPAKGGLAELRLNGGSAVFDLGIDGIQLRLDRIVLPADMLSLPSLQLPAAGWRGTMVLSGIVADCRWNGETTAKGRTSWLDAASSLLEDYPLGTLESTWQWRGNSGIEARITGGAQGKVTIDTEFRRPPQSGGRLVATTMTGSIRLEADARERLTKYVRLLGRPNPSAPDLYELKWPAS